MVTIRREIPTFAVGDVDAARAFYSDTLGLRVTVLDNGEGLVLRLGSGTPVFLYPKEDHQPAGFTVLHLEVDDVDQVVDELTAKGVEFVRYNGFGQDEKGVARGFMAGGDGAWVTDPSGNVIGFADGTGTQALFDES
ncbi:VOC family protein [Myceligenerans xiligouense]|uniref:Glyoxalase/bleomycin resistance protein/dioxygenase superfamily protein n=1 Tax=Myceligenerans xiligouense TaxID=253184 RepID=A0A3N4ZUB6_9MICO|nr:VOC family protein [Myceligenerans xiligouense]RPF23341.1 glyoxalase/bleomycin resistance protein/dioxygenase superfamily protein [Myceligenerans xiligouense]